MRYTQEMIDKFVTIENGGKYIRNVNFSYYDLSRLDLSDITFEECKFEHTDLTGTILHRKYNSGYEDLDSIRTSSKYVADFWSIIKGK